MLLARFSNFPAVGLIKVLSQNSNLIKKKQTNSKSTMTAPKTQPEIMHLA